MKKLGNKIIKILALDKSSYKVKLKFDDRQQGVVDLSYLFNKPKGLVAEVLKGDLFNSCFIESGALAWPNGLEFCPDMLKHLLSEQSKKKAA